MLNSYFPLPWLRTSCKKYFYFVYERERERQQKTLIFIAIWQDLPHYTMIYTTQTPLLRCKLIMFLSEVSVGLQSQCNTKYVRLHLNYQVLGLDLVCWSKVVFVLSGHPMVSMLQYCRLQPALVLAGRGQHLDLIADIVPSSVSWQPSVSTGLAGPLLRQITHNSPLELGIFAPSEIAHCRLNLFKLA